MIAECSVNSTITSLNMIVESASSNSCQCSCMSDGNTAVRSSVSHGYSGNNTAESRGSGDLIVLMTVANIVAGK